MIENDSSAYVLVTGARHHYLELVKSVGRPARVRHCPGAEHVDCPLARGGRCSLLEEAAASVVYLAGEHEFHEQGRWRCVAASTAPVVVALEGGLQPPRAKGSFAVVGGGLGPQAVLQAVDALLEPSDAPLPKAP